MPVTLGSKFQRVVGAKFSDRCKLRRTAKGVKYLNGRHEVWVPHISLVFREMWDYHNT